MFMLKVSLMKELDLFDDFSYKTIKDIIHEDDDEIEVEIADLGCDRYTFTFEIECNVFSVGKEYDCNSHILEFLKCGILMYLKEIEEEEEYEDEDIKANKLFWSKYFEEKQKECDEMMMKKYPNWKHLSRRERKNLSPPSSDDED